MTTAARSMKHRRGGRRKCLISSFPFERATITVGSIHKRTASNGSTETSMVISLSTVYSDRVQGVLYSPSTGWGTITSGQYVHSFSDWVPAESWDLLHEPPVDAAPEE